MYMHKDGCGRPAFIYCIMPEEGDMALAKHAILLDGKQPKSGAMMFCGSCGMGLRLSRDNLVPIDDDDTSPA